MGRIVAIDTETTGLDPYKHDIIQIACVALQPNFLPEKAIQPFYMLIKPAHYEDTEAYQKEIEPAMNVNKIKMNDLLTKGFHPIKAAELFEEWWTRLGGHELEPLCQNYPFDSTFIKQWLGPISYSHFFSRYYRDTYVAARYLNDCADYRGDKRPFPNKLNLSQLAYDLKVEHKRAHDAFYDCLTCAEVWRQMCNYVPIGKNVPEDMIC